MVAARQLVDAPSFATLPYGLWDAVQKPDAPSHWQAGITFEERCAVADTTYDECITVTGDGEPPPPDPKAATFGQRFRGAQPFTIFAEFDCSPVGLTDAATVASDALSRVENRQVEESFWTGVAGGQTVVLPHLAADTEITDSDGIVLQTAASVVVTGSDVVIGLGLLEDALGDCYGGPGVIHIPRSALPTFVAWNLALPGPGGGLFTPSGHRIVVSDGYAGTAPDGSAPPAGSTWIYATGAVFGYRSDVRFFRTRESFDRTENTMKMIAERTYVIAYECCLLAALVTLGTGV
jgi:hypothetical protein